MLLFPCFGIGVAEAFGFPLRHPTGLCFGWFVRFRKFCIHDYASSVVKSRSADFVFAIAFEALSNGTAVFVNFKFDGVNQSYPAGLDNVFTDTNRAPHV